MIKKLQLLRRIKFKHLFILLATPIIFSACEDGTKKTPLSLDNPNNAPQEQSTASSTPAQKCISTTNDLTDIIRKNYQGNIDSIKFTWSSEVLTSVRADTGLINCEANLDLKLDSLERNLSAIPYEITPLADGTGSRISIELGQVTQVISELVDQYNSELTEKEQKEANLKYETFKEINKSVAGVYSEDKFNDAGFFVGFELSVSFNRQGVVGLDNSLDLAMKSSCCSGGGGNASLVDAKTIVFEKGECNYKFILDEDKMHMHAYISKSEGARECMYGEHHDLLLTKR